MNKVKESVKTQGAKTVKNEGVKLTPVVKPLTAKQIENNASKVKAFEQATKELHPKLIGDKVINPSKAVLNNQVKIILLEAKKDKNLNEVARLYCALDKSEYLTPSKPFIIVSKSVWYKEFIREIGLKKLPTFEDIKNVLPYKYSFTNQDIYNAITKLSPKHKINLKIERQNKATKAK